MKESTFPSVADKGEIILYQPSVNLSIPVKLENDTIWLTQQQIADLFGTKRPAITKHLNNIYKSGELDKETTCSILEHMGNDEKQHYVTTFYNLDAIISVGYRVNSVNATAFRRWATDILTQHVLKGYSFNQHLVALQQQMESRMTAIEFRQEKHQQQIDFFARTSLPPVEGIFFENQIFDAYVFVSKLIKTAKKSIVLIDNYIDESVLTLLDKRESSVSATIYTQRISPQLQLDIDKHNAQYQPIELKIYKNAHDRFIIIDDDIYHIGASIKDLGKKLFAFSKLTEFKRKEIIERL